MIYSILSDIIDRVKATILLLIVMSFFFLNAGAQNIIYVSPTGTGDGSSWGATTTFAAALEKAQAGDEIWMKGFSQITDVAHLYVTPSKEGWTVPSGVKVYGGFEGVETNINQRKNLGKTYQFTYRTVLSGDIKKDDNVDPNNFIFPENTLRSDNAKHVLVLNAFRDGGDNLNDNSYPTVIDGLTITGGHASDFGGGVYVKGSDIQENSVPYSIDRCYLFNNYALNGGAIYVDASVKKTATQSLINQCVVYNNVAGTLIGKENLGGGIYVAGAGNIVNCSVFNNENGGVVLSGNAYLVNTTVARNTGGGVDMTSEYKKKENDFHVYNSVIWGNSFVAAAIKDEWPAFSYSAYPDAVEEDGNINLSTNNQGDKTSPRFDAPSLKTSFDTDYDWRRTAYPLWSWKLLEGSYLIDKGSNSSYDVYAEGYNGIVGTDLAGITRQIGYIDINAYEFQTVPAARIRYVKVDGSDSNDGTSWDKAYASVQKAINDLALSQPGVPGEVWVAAGIYEPTELINGNGTPASFRMYDGISLYGGFAGTETTKSERERVVDNPMPWRFANATVLRGSTFDGENTWNATDRKWSVTSASTHVVWFAPLPGKEDFANTTVMEGFTIEGGQAKVSEAMNYDGDKGAGVYMKGANVYLIHSVVKNNVAPSVGGGIYLKDGRVQGCLVYNNSSETNGGGIYVDNAGLVLRSMITNNSAINGGGVYLDNNSVQDTDGKWHPEYQILSTSVITNNTSVHNGAVYCNKGGIVLQSTIANNETPTATDNASDNASQTGGLYIDTYAKVVNSVLWNNVINELKVQAYAANPSTENVEFHYSAVANMNNIVWNNTLQDELIELSESNRLPVDGVLDPGFEPDSILNKLGVDGSMDRITYFWKPVTGSNLRARGMSLGMLPESVLVAPELDITGKLFDQKPAVGAYRVEKTEIKPEKGSNYLRIYVDVECTEPSHNGESWEKAYRSLNEAIDYMAGLTEEELEGINELQIYVMEGNAWPRYASVNLDPKSATLEVPAMASGKKLTVKGGFSRENHNWAPLTYRSQINGNHDGKNIEDGLYHCITVEKGAEVEFDGLHIINGYAAGTANLKYGAGMLVRDGANVTVKNSIFENNTAVEGAAIDARGATLTLINCVVNNNTNTTNTEQIINCPNLTLHHVSVVNNDGAAPSDMGISSFAAGNTSGNTFDYASLGAEGYKNFANPTNKKGATLGYDTYLGGYSNFAPLTSSADAGNLINKASGTPAGLDRDIAGNERNLGGAPDLGAYEASLPANGSVIYVTANGAGKMDGSSWENAIAGNLIYDVNNKKLVEENVANVATTDSRYIGFYDASARPYGEISGASKLFFEHMGEAGVIAGTAVDNANYKWETHDGQTHITGANGIDIQNNRQESYVGGLQYAVELAAAAAAGDGIQRKVWVAGGTYTDYKGFVIRDKVDVLGGFPNEGTPGEDDRHPLISQYITAKASDTDLDKTKYETIIQIQDVKPWVDNNGTPGANPDADLPASTRKPVLFQPDVCVPTMSPTGRQSSYTYWNWVDRVIFSDYWEGPYLGNSVPGADENASNTYRYDLPEGQRNGTYVEYRGATWDGFTIRHGFYTDYSANRDGGAGVRMFRGVTLQNCVVADNYINNYNATGSACMGAGIYCDGDNSKVVNCYITGNANRNPEAAGGGMTLMVGVSYNCIVTNNYSQKDGGGCFIENAYFYNNTVANNKAIRLGGGIHQWTRDNATMNLVLYNTILYGNVGAAITSDNVTKFNGAFNCYIQSDRALDSKIVNNAANWNTQYGVGSALPSPFESGSYRLSDGSYCINRGTEALGEGISLPATDVDFTDRIKDCTVDIGAYESDNETNIAYENSGDTLLIYYVDQNGAGLRNGSSVTNAACAMKLQQILTHAGKTALANQTKEVVVKIAGDDSKAFVYNANTLSDPDDPQSYTFAVPYGVTVEGGYSEDFTKRIPKTYQTILSAVCNSASLGQEVNGYHVITFGEKPEEWTGADKKTVIDGLYLKHGKATSMAGEGNPNTRGGGAIVPSWTHVRNCVVEECEAIQGGGLYLMSGATVSGSLIMNNKAEEGAGVYADNENASETLRAHIISNTISDNTATSKGGGIYLENGAVLATNTVIWGNTAPSDKNVSGVVGTTFKDAEFTKVVGKGAIPEFYPFNHCYVETYELPSNYENTSMKSDEELYFAGDRTLKAYSELIKHGTVNQDSLVAVFSVAKQDMQGINRKQSGSERIDVGAYAFNGGLIPLPDNSEDVVKKIFVSQGSNVEVSGTMDDYIGRSFYTSLSWLDDALEYIKNVREVSGLENTVFEIYLAGGTYKPSNRRTDADTDTIDQRHNSYVIPAGVKIYGGFKGDEPYGYGIPNDEIQYKDENNVSRIIPIGDVSETDTLSKFINNREYSDLNNNGVKEPWELANQSILSGDINVSSTVKNAYHVVYSSVSDGGSGSGSVLLDGLTIKDGETWHKMSPTLDEDEVGRGGAIYTNGIDYVLKGCRILNSKAVRGGAIYARDANLTIAGSVIAGNGTVENAETSDGQDIRGGAVYMSGYSKNVALKAINTLWANNETAGKGGAIATSNDLGFTKSVTLSLMNNTIVRNKAAEASAVYSTSNGTITNTVMWGGVGTGVVSAGLTINNSASEVELTGTDNVKLGEENMAIDGPRFAQPSSVAGVAGNSVASKWNPASISVLTDAGDGELDYNEQDITKATGAYKNWWNGISSDCPEIFYTGNDTYKRYMGQKPLFGAAGQPKVIDIGLYEYQYKSSFQTMDEIYVDTQEHGDGSGDSWSNATSDLRGAIIAFSDPAGGKTDKVIYIRDGEYPQSQLYVGGIAYQVNMNGSNSNLNSLTIKGSYAENGLQDFSQPTVFLPLQSKPVNTLFYAETNGKTLNIEGITFSGALASGFSAENNGGTVKLKNVALRKNKTGADIQGTGNTLIANTLFADGTVGLTAEGDNVTVVNATFANNRTAVSGTQSIYNTVAWNSGEGVATDTGKHNVNLGTVDNDDILNGPNFVDPENGNYMIRPSISLLDVADAGQYNTLIGADAVNSDKDLADNARLTGEGLDIGAYEYNAALQGIIYVKSNVAQTDGSGSSWQNPIKDLQGAIDLASIYANKNKGENAYVFVHRDVDASNVRVNMPGVKVYGGMNDETGNTATDIINARSSVLSDDMSVINGLTVNGKSSLVDGFSVSGDVNVTQGMLSTSVVEENAEVGTDGIIYNSFVRGNVNGDGKAVNVTSPNALAVTEKINVFDAASENGYVTGKDIWNYQLKEDNPAIDSEANTGIDSYISLAGHSFDLSGARRVRNIVDAGCFETWNIAANTTLSATEVPTENHVVYVRKGIELDIAEGLYPEGKNFNVGFLLLEHGAGLRGNGNSISLNNFAVERELDESNNRWDMSYMPFDIISTEGAENVTVKTYDGAARADYDYKFSSTDGAWAVCDIQGFLGMMMQSENDAKVRMYGNAYEEREGQDAQIRLAKYNNMSPWSSETSASSSKFTHLENMSWNMFGSPFLCAMNYEDMEYGRVIYKKKADTYESVNTIDVAEGSVEAGSAVFTQTATLKTYEIFNVNQRTKAVSENTGNYRSLVLAISNAGSDTQDEMSLKAVPTEESSSEFNMAADGVKMMSVSDEASQIYIERSGKRYSMLSAVDIEGTVSVGLNIKEAGMFAISVPEECDAAEYETVVLTDKSNGNVVDLLDAPYEFTSAESGDITGRFTIQFNLNGSNDGSNLNVYSDSYGAVIVEGLADGMNIRMYDASGKMVAARKAVSPVERFTECESGVYLVQILVNEGEPKVFKVHVR